MKRGFLLKSNVIKKMEDKEKKQSLIKKEVREENGSDRISSLPNVIIHHILSFLDMKQVVATSVLSKKWRNFWVSVPILNIDEEFWIDEHNDLKTGRFIDFVSTVLRTHDGSKIQKFRLVCPNYVSSHDHISDWVISVVQKNVQDLYLEGMSMPPPSSFCLSTTLKTLELKHVTLSEEMEENWCCPALENLILENCFHDYLDKLLISSPRLKYLKVQSEFDSETGGPNACDIKICAPNLEVLECIGFLYQDYCLENLSSLVTACFDTEHVCCEDVMEVLDRCLNNILKGLTHVSSLTLSLRDFQGSAELGSMLKVEPNSFPNLKYLKLIDWRTDRHIQGVAKLFECFSCIETLILQKAEVNPAMYSEDRTLGERVQFAIFEGTADTYGPTMIGDWDKQLEHSSVFRKLKIVEVHNLRGSENEYDFIEYLLKTAPVLENMKIIPGKGLSRNKQLVLSLFYKKIQSQPKASSSATISFV